MSGLFWFVSGLILGGAIGVFAMAAITIGILRPAMIAKDADSRHEGHF